MVRGWDREGGVGAQTDRTRVSVCAARVRGNLRGETDEFSSLQTRTRLRRRAGAILQREDGSLGHVRVRRASLLRCGLRRHVC